MRSGKWYFLPTILLSAAIAGLAGSGCKKIDGTKDNDQVIRTPYSLYFGDKEGVLQHTNDGQAYEIDFVRDGVPARTLIASGPNMVMVKIHLALGPNGSNFTAKKYDPFVVDKTAWQSFAINAYNRTYLAGVGGILESTDNGLSWPNSNSNTYTVHSFARLPSGHVVAIDSSGVLYLKDAPNGTWNTITVNTPFPAGIFHLANFNNALVAADYGGSNGVWYSNDEGVNWAQYSGLPGNQEIRAIHSPMGQGLLVGTDSSGIYRLVGTNLEPSNNGLAPFTTVYGITTKQDIYKNEIIRHYVYIATSTGLYRSEDLGQNWALMKGGDIRCLY